MTRLKGTLIERATEESKKSTLKGSLVTETGKLKGSLLENLKEKEKVSEIVDFVNFEEMKSAIVTGKVTKFTSEEQEYTVANIADTRSGKVVKWKLKSGGTDTPAFTRLRGWYRDKRITFFS